MQGKWIILCLTFLIFITKACSMPTSVNINIPTKTIDISKRGETPTEDDDDVIDYHHSITSRSSSLTRSSASPTQSSSKDSNDKDNGNKIQTTAIPALTPEWYSRYSILTLFTLMNNSFIATVYGSESGITPQMAALGAILIAFGVFLCVMGFRMFKPMLFVMGLLTFGSMTWIALANCKPSNGYINDHITMIVVPAGLGILGAALYVHFWYITIYLVGGKRKPKYLYTVILILFVSFWRTCSCILFLHVEE